MPDISKKYVGSNLVLTSGVLIVRPNEHVWIIPYPTVPNSLTLEIEFEDNALFPAQIETVIGPQPHITKVRVRNFTFLQGTFSLGPTHVGSINGRPVYLDVIVNHFSASQGLASQYVKMLSYMVTIQGTSDV